MAWIKTGFRGRGEEKQSEGENDDSTKTKEREEMETGLERQARAKQASSKKGAEQR